MARVKITPEAHFDLETIAEVIARDDLERALSFTYELEEACYELVDHPERFALLKGHETEKVRWRVFGNYLIIYRVNNGDVEVLRIVNGAMDLNEVFG